ncbi:hypothetical protein JTB14_033653, partial [Gonioctena quinquepunctata]
VSKYICAVSLLASKENENKLSDSTTPKNQSSDEGENARASTLEPRRCWSTFLHQLTVYLRSVFSQYALSRFPYFRPEDGPGRQSAE